MRSLPSPGMGFSNHPIALVPSFFCASHSCYQNFILNHCLSLKYFKWARSEGTLSNRRTGQVPWSVGWWGERACLIMKSHTASQDLSLSPTLSALLLCAAGELVNREWRSISLFRIITPFHEHYELVQMSCKTMGYFKGSLWSQVEPTDNQLILLV